MNNHEETRKHSRQKHKRRKTVSERDKIKTRHKAKRPKVTSNEHGRSKLDFKTFHKNEQFSTSAVTQNRLTNRLGLFAHGKKSEKISREPIYTAETAKAKADADLMKIIDLADAGLQKPLTPSSLRKCSKFSNKPKRTEKSARSPESESDTVSSISDEFLSQGSEKGCTSPTSVHSFSKSVPIHEIASLSKQLKPSMCYPGRNMLQEMTSGLKKLLKQNAPMTPALSVISQSGSYSPRLSSQDSHTSRTKGKSEEKDAYNVIIENEELKLNKNNPRHSTMIATDSGESKDKDALTFLIESEERRLAQEASRVDHKTDDILTESQEKDAYTFFIEKEEFHERNLSKDIHAAEHNRKLSYGHPTSSTDVHMSLNTTNPGFIKDQTRAYHPVVQQSWNIPSQICQNAAVVTEMNPAAHYQVHQRAFPDVRHHEQYWKREHLQQNRRFRHQIPEAMDILDYVDVKDPTTIDLSAYHDLIVAGTLRTSAGRKPNNYKKSKDFLLETASSVDSSPSPEQEFYRRKMF